MEYVFVGIGGVFGALARYGLSKWVGQRWQGRFPLATFGINITGSFVLGFLYILFSKAIVDPTYVRDLAATGFLGAFTTYSTFSYEIINLVEDGERSAGVKYFLASVVIGLISAYASIVLAEHL